MTMTCPNGHSNVDGTAFCAICGSSLRFEPATPPPAAYASPTALPAPPEQAPSIGLGAPAGASAPSGSEAQASNPTTPVSHTAAPSSAARAGTIRDVVLWVIAALAVIVAIGALMSSGKANYSIPAPFTDTSSTSAAALVISSYETNAATTENVYQQIVVTEWANKDLLKVIADQNSDIIANQAKLSQQASAAAENQVRAAIATNTLLTYLIALTALLVITLVAAVFMMRRKQT